MSLISLVQFLVPWDGQPVCCEYDPGADPALPLNREADLLYSSFHRPSSSPIQLLQEPWSFLDDGRGKTNTEGEDSQQQLHQDHVCRSQLVPQPRQPFSKSFSSEGR